MKIHIHSIDAIMKWLGVTHDASLPDPANYPDRYFQVPVMENINVKMENVNEVSSMTSPVLYGVIFGILDANSENNMEDVMKIINISHYQMIKSLKEPKEKG